MSTTLDELGTRTLDLSKNETQRAALLCTARYECYSGGFGSGKTSVLCQKGIALSGMIPNNLGAVLRETYPDLRDTTRKVFLELTPRDWVKYWKESENALTLKNNSVILFRFFEKGVLKVGANLGWYFIDQAEEASEEIFKGLMGRLRRPVPRRYGLLAMNPNGMDWQYRYFVKENKPQPGAELCTCGRHPKSNFAYFESSSYDNSANLPSGYIEDMVAKYPPEWIERFIMGRWTKMSGLIYHEFDEDVHLVDPFEIPASWVKVRGNDWGVDAPATCSFIAVKPPEPGQTLPSFFIFFEYGDREKTPEQHADTIKELSRSYGAFRASIMDDSAFARGDDLKSVADKYRDRGIPLLRGTKDQLASILTVKELFRTNRLFLFRGLTDRHVEELKAWKWGSPKNGKEVPARGNDHYIDGARYGLHWLVKKMLWSPAGAGQPVTADRRHQYGRLTIGSQAIASDPVTGMPA